MAREILAAAFLAVVLVGLNDAAPKKRASTTSSAKKGKRTSSRRTGGSEKSPTVSPAKNSPPPPDDGIALLRRLEGHWKFESQWTFGGEGATKEFDLHVNADNTFNLRGDFFSYTYWNAHLTDQLANLWMENPEDEHLDEIKFSIDEGRFIVYQTGRISPINKPKGSGEYFRFPSIILKPGLDANTMTLCYAMACTPQTCVFKRTGEARNQTAPADVGHEVAMFKGDQKVERPLEPKQLRVPVPEREFWF